MMVHMRRPRPRPLRLSHDLIDLVERVLDGGVLVEDDGDGRAPAETAPGEAPPFSIPLGRIDVLTLHTGHTVHPVPGGHNPLHRR